jgi:hypothetical protein
MILSPYAASKNKKKGQESLVFVLEHGNLLLVCLSIWKSLACMLEHL